MSNLENKTREVYGKVDDLMKAYINTFGGFEVLEQMDEESFKLFKKVISMIDESKNLEIEKSKVLDEINKKLDLLLSKK